MGEGCPSGGLIPKVPTQILWQLNLFGNQTKTRRRFSIEEILGCVESAKFGGFELLVTPQPCERGARPQHQIADSYIDLCNSDRLQSRQRQEEEDEELKKGLKNDRRRRILDSSYVEGVNLDTLSSSQLHNHVANVALIQEKNTKECEPSTMIANFIKCKCLHLTQPPDRTQQTHKQPKKRMKAAMLHTLSVEIVLGLGGSEIVLGCGGWRFSKVQSCLSKCKSLDICSKAMEWA